MNRDVKLTLNFFRRDCGPNKNEDRSLSEDQKEKLINVANQVIDQIASFESRTRAAGGTDSQTVRNGRYEIVREALSSLSETVTPDGAAKIRVHVLNHVKRRIQLVDIKIPNPSPAQ